MAVFSNVVLRFKCCFSLLSCCRQAKAELRTAMAKVDEMTKLLQNVQDQMQRRVREGEKHSRMKKDIAFLSH